MAPRPVAERPPKGLNSYWTHVWDRALVVLKEQGTWAWEQKPLLDEYVFALRAAEATRDGFEWISNYEPAASEDVDWMVLRQIAGSGPTAWDRHTKRAAALAQALVLTPKARHELGIGTEDDKADDPFASFNAAPQDELAPRRRRAG